MTAGLTFAVVGAGLAGLTCARALGEHGASVVVFDKGRRAGGRITTRRVEPHAFDLGAQYFTAKTEVFAAEVERWRAAGVCTPWAGRIVALDFAGAPRRPTPPIARHVGTPGMSAVGRHLAHGLDVRAGHRVDSITRHAGKLELRGTVSSSGLTLGPSRYDARATDDLGTYDAVVVCLPAPQAAPLLRSAAPTLAARAAAVTFDPCFAVGFAATSRDAAALESLDFDGAFIGREGDGDGEHPAEDAPSPLGWVARDSSKPGRPEGERWVLHATSAWSRDALELPEAEVVPALLGAFAGCFGLGRLEPDVALVRRWLFARARPALSCGSLLDEEGRIGLGGDWAAGGRVEGAFLSGLDVARQVLARRGVGDVARGTPGSRS